ncbi:hypothetical protein WJX74_006064 [Apatococcus lobatus]|uniref:Uncharacterized protein n=1 Tax=Apatococcus lobatus TaxID=904363 RepID=A0AAW1RUP2_9CHLO
MPCQCFASSISFRGSASGARHASPCCSSSSKHQQSRNFSAMDGDVRPGLLFSYPSSRVTPALAHSRWYRAPQDRIAAKVSARFLGYELSLQQLVKDVEWVEGPRKWAGLLPGRMQRIERSLPWYTGLQDAWQELQLAAADFWSWHLAHAGQQLQHSWQHLQQSAPHFGHQLHQQLLFLWQHLQRLNPSTAVPVAVFVLAALAAVRAVLQERQRRARRRQHNAQQRAANAESLLRQADRFRRALNQFGDEEPSFSHAPSRPDPWHPDPSAEPIPDYSSYRSRHAGETDVAFLSTYDSDTLLQHYRDAGGDLDASSVPSGWATNMSDTPGRARPSLPAAGPVPEALMRSGEALPGMNPEDWDEQARAEWTAFLRKSKMFQVPEDGWWDADHSDELLPPQPLQTLDYNA